ncbi:MAG: cytochrome-c peroxidase, partial [Paracoccaceae bacterium]
MGKGAGPRSRLSASGGFSCHSRHNLTTGGDDDIETGGGHGWQQGARRSPTGPNPLLDEAQFGDGRTEDLKAQAKGTVQ